MELLARFGTPHQKEKWLRPLLNGEIRSCFAMTEPDVASSDPTNLAATVVRQGPMYVVNGRKWWTTGAKDPRCHLILFLGRGPNAEQTDSTHRRHSSHSIVLIPMKARGVRLIRHLTVMGYDDAPHGHAEMEYCNVTVPIAEALLLGEGRGFEAAQSRLGGGRLHHCMRAVGYAERALELMIDRATARKAFDRNLSQFDSVLQFIAESRCDIEQGRHVVLRAAASVDNGDMRSARRDVAVAKIVVPRLVHNVIDRAVQVHGALGVSQDTTLAAMLAMIRSLRLADGPDEVHLVTVANMELRTRRKSIAKL
jgi:acyl-CoA dehydrogenase